VQTCLLIAEVAVFYKIKDMTLNDALHKILKCIDIIKRK